MRPRRSAALLAAVLSAAAFLLSACPPSDSCSADAQRGFVRDGVRSWYLYPDTLPAQDPPPPASGSLQDYLDLFTANARAQGWDRYWSYVASYSATMAYYGTGGSIGFGFSLQIRGTAPSEQLFVIQVVSGAAADGAGFLRGDEILAIGDSPSTLALVTDLLAAGGTALSDAIGSSVAGRTRYFLVQPVGAAPGATVVRSMTTTTYVLDPVPYHNLIDRSALGLRPAGYVNLRTFISTADDELRTVFAGFESADVTDVVVDLRYNGGGLVSTATVLANLLGGGLGPIASPPAPARTMYTVGYNPAHAAEAPSPVLFDPDPIRSVTAHRIAFVMTGATASASELVANVMEPYVEVAIVGAKSYGKPVGQLGFSEQSCDLLLGLIAFRLSNAEGEGGYYDGLPDAAGNFSGPLCAAEDDLAHEMGDPLEASTAKALDFLANGAAACPAPAASSTALLGAARVANPSPPDPSPAQRDVAGLF